jgi:hypothetical protein
VIRGRYAILPRDHDSEYYGRGKFFCSTTCEGQWLDEHMTAIEMRIPVPFITHRRESQGYAKVKNDESRWGPEYSIQRIE